jgi:hypothetical protein
MTATTDGSSALDMVAAISSVFRLHSRPRLDTFVDAFGSGFRKPGAHDSGARQTTSTRAP